MLRTCSFGCMTRLLRSPLRAQQSEINQWKISRNASTKMTEDAKREEEKWEKFLECSPKMDPENEKDVNTFITLFKDQNEIEKLELNPMVNLIQEATDLESGIQINALFLKYEGKKGESDKFLDLSKEIKQEILRKVELMTAPLILNADELYKQEEAKRVAGKVSQKDQANEQLYFKTKDFQFAIMVPHVHQSSRGSFNFRNMDFGEIGMNDLRQVAGKQGLRVFWTSFDYLSPRDKYSRDRVVGGIVDPTYIESKLDPKEFKNWKIRQNYEKNEAVVKIPYQLDPSSASTYFPKVQFALPSYLYLSPSEKVKAMMWSKNNDGWSTENVEDVKLVDFDKKLISISVTRFAPVAMVQDRCTDYPYRSWKIRSVSDQIVLLDIQGKRLPSVMKFEIGPGYVKLLPRPEAEFKELINVPLKPAKLLGEMARCGVLLMPTNDDAAELNISSKSIQAEYNAINDLVMAVRAYYIKSSRWNMSLKGDRVLVRMKENLEHDQEFFEDQEKEWKSVVWWENKCGVINAKESSEKLDKTFLEDTTTHATLFLLLKKHDLANYEIFDRLMDTHQILTSETLKKLLKMLRLLSFTVST